jgi:hypothetical protein
MFVKTLLRMIVFVSGTVATATPVCAGLLTSTVRVQWIAPTVTSVYQDGGIKVVSNGIEYPSNTVAGNYIDITDNQFIINLGSNETEPSFLATPFNGFVLTIESGPFLSSASVNPASQFSPVNMQIVNGRQLQLNYSGVPVGPNMRSVIDIGLQVNSCPITQTNSCSLTRQQYFDTFIKPGLEFFPVTPGDIEFGGMFRPPPGMTLAQVASLGGFSHFNWFQQVTEYPGYDVPFVDPHSGGLPGGAVWADDLPFYWDEKSCPLNLPIYCDQEMQLSENVENGFLLFSDIPRNSNIPEKGSKMTFITSLAGVRSDGTFELLGQPKMWSSDYHCSLTFLLCSGGVSTSRNLTPYTEGGVGGIFDVVDVTDIMELPYGVRLQMVQSGATNVPLTEVPEPSTIALIGMALLSLFGFGMMRRRAEA